MGKSAFGTFLKVKKVKMVMALLQYFQYISYLLNIPYTRCKLFIIKKRIKKH